MSTPASVRSAPEGGEAIKPTEAATRLGISRQRIHKLLQDGRLTGTPVLGTVSWEIDPESVEAYRRSQKEEGRPEAA
jgi:excisionase family DNA binding protein